MSVRQGFAPTTLSLIGSEGELVSVRICVEPRFLEDLLEALATVSFPINPQIYHHGGVGYVYPDGRERVISTTIVEFPAFSKQLDEVRDVLSAHGLPGELAQVRSMIQDIHAR